MSYSVINIFSSLGVVDIIEHNGPAEEVSRKRCSHHSVVLTALPLHQHVGVQPHCGRPPPQLLHQVWDFCLILNVLMDIYIYVFYVNKFWFSSQ